MDHQTATPLRHRMILAAWTGAGVRLAWAMLCAVLIGLVPAPANAACTGTTVATAFKPSVISISKSTPIGQVVASSVVTLTVTCNDSGLLDPAHGGWSLNYTPQTPLVATSLSQQTFATSLPGLGYRMYLPNGNLIAPTSYGVNGGDNFGVNCMGPSSGGTLCSMPLGNSTQTFRFRLDLVRTSTSLVSGTFKDSLVRFGYQNSSGGHTSDSGPGEPTWQFGQQPPSPVTFQFSNATCNLSAGSANQVITLPTIANSALTSVGATAGATRFKLDLQDCVTQTMVTMNIGGTAATVGSVLQNAGTAQGVGVQLLKGGPDGAPLQLNTDIGMGSVGASTTMSISLAARYYQLGTVAPGTVDSVATVSLYYN